MMLSEYSIELQVAESFHGLASTLATPLTSLARLGRWSKTTVWPLALAKES